MTTDTDDTETPTGFAEAMDRDQVLALLEDAIREAHRKVESGRVYDAENEKVRIQWVRALAYTAGQYRQIKNDEDLEEMREEIEALKARGGDGGGFS